MVSPAGKKAKGKGSNNGFTVNIYNGAPTGNAHTVKEVANGIYWLGEENEDPFHCNPYLVVEGDDCVVVDPGGLLYAESILDKVRSVIDPSKIRYLIAQHQDPDVCSAVNAFRPHVDPDCKIVCHSRMAVLIKHLGSGFDFYEVDKKGNSLTVGSRRFTFGHTPYLHSPGAIVTYDAKTKTVFTSDLFGGITEDWDLFADDNYYENIVSFHGGYMPSNEILQNGLKQIKALGPIDAIMPQHGSIIEKKHVAKLFERLEKLQVGMYADENFADMVAKQQESLRMRQMVETASLNLMAADEKGTIIYMNPNAKRTLKKIEHLLPIKVEEIVGKSFDIFHKDPSYQQGLLRDPRNSFPRKAIISLAEEKLELNASAVYDEEGTFLGPMVSWEIITERIKAEEREALVKEKITNTTSELTKSAEEMKEVSLSMSSSADQTSSQADTVSEYSVTVSGNINTVVTSMEGMSTSITEISQNADESSQIVQEAVGLAGNANEIITALGASSKEIGEVIKVINSITQQTNLLALNARIEAARAGEAGKGFAVVANEVKELAKETAKSTKDITDKVEKIQSDTEKAVGAIQSIAEIINKISDITTTIASSVEEQSVTSSEITKNMSEAAKGIDEISTNISGVAEAATETSKGASKTSGAAGALTDLAETLKTIVNEFESK